MPRTRRRLLAAVAASALAPLASGCANRPESRTTTGRTDGTTTDELPAATDAPSTTDSPPPTDACTTPEGDLVADLAVQDDREDETPFAVTITRSDGTVVYERTFGADESTDWNGRIFEETTYYEVDVSVEDGPSTSKDVSVTGEDWMRRYGVYVVVEEDDVNISTYHGEPVCP